MNQLGPSTRWASGLVREADNVLIAIIKSNTYFEIPMMPLQCRVTCTVC